MITIEYDKPIEVTKEQYNRVMRDCSGIVAGCEENGKYFVKCWLMKYVSYVEQCLTNL